VEGGESEELERERDKQGERFKGRERGSEIEGGEGEERERGLFGYAGLTVCVCWIREIEGKREGERERMND
jgi:hypothetical protein